MMLKKTILNIAVILLVMTVTGNSQIINLSNSSNTASVHPWVLGFDNGKIMVVWMEGTHQGRERGQAAHPEGSIGLRRPWKPGTPGRGVGHFKSSQKDLGSSHGSALFV